MGFISGEISIAPITTAGEDNHGRDRRTHAAQPVAANIIVTVLIALLTPFLDRAGADSVGSGGLLNEVSQRKISVPVAFASAGALAIVIVWLADPFEVMALSSRAFALIYALQCVLALIVSLKDGKGSTAQRLGFVLIGLVCLAAVAVGAPAEG
jgi:hypothetical protein